MSFRIFDINTLIQLGSPVKIKNLKSEAGQKLNGKLGEVVGVSTNAERWVVKYENDEDEGIVGMSSLKIQNLEWAGDRSKLKEQYLSEMDGVDGGQVVAGTIDKNNGLCLAIMLGTKETSEMKDHINAQFLQMGVPEDMWIGGPHPFEQTIKGAIKKRSGERYFAALGGGLSKGPISELGITAPTGGQCVNCGKEATKTCSSCHTGYCSSTCQKKHWKEHRVQCKAERSKKVKEAWKKYDDELLHVERPDGEIKPLCRKDDDGDMVEWDVVQEGRIFFNGEDGPVDTGFIVRYRVKLDDEGVAVAAMMFSQAGNGGSFQVKENLEKVRDMMTGMMFYEQPFLLTEMFKLKTKGQLLGDKVSITSEELHAELENIAHRKCDFTMERIPIQETKGLGNHLIETGYFQFIDIINKDFFVEKYFDGVNAITSTTPA